MELTPKGTSAIQGNESAQSTGPSLIEMIKNDSELKEFFRLVHQYDLREKAVEAINAKMNRPALKPYPNN